MNRPIIVLDGGGLDVPVPRNGQFRYVSDLLRGLADIAPPARFVFLGGTPEPQPEFAGVFEARSRWRYEHFPRTHGRGSMVLDQLRLAIVLWRLKADLCHSLHTALPVLAPCPVVGTVLDLMFELFPEYAQAVRSRPYRLFRWAARHQARRLVCISATTADDVKRLWRVPSSRIDVIQLGTNFLGHSTAVAVAEVLAHDRVVLSPYNLEPRKNLAGLLRAFARCRPACAQLVLYGRAAVTPQREAEFDALVAELGLAPKVIRVGYVTDAELRWLYRRASVFVFPSLYEGFGYPVLEAMAAGARVVARTASAPAEVVGPAGVLVETADPEQLASAIDRLLADSERASVLGRLAAARAEEYTVSRMAEQTWRVYQKALGRCDQT